jgi:hypothetical protein
MTSTGALLSRHTVVLPAGYRGVGPLSHTFELHPVQLPP